MSALEQAWYRGNRWLWLLRPVEILFRCLIALRRWLFKVGVLASWRASCKVLVVGNITVGGAGKTPVVTSLVEQLQAAGLAVGVVSRGYGGSAPHYPYSVSNDSPAAFAGDEPLMLHRRTGVPVMVDPQRTAAARALLASHALDLLISDDGLQHYALERDMEIVLVDGRRKLGNGFCLPAGPLREPPSRLDDVDFVLQRGGDQADVIYRVDGLVNLRSGEQIEADPQQFSDTPALIAGIGQPAQFFNSLEARGFAGGQTRFPDHHLFTEQDFSSLRSGPIIMTEKDAVKCAAFALDNWWYLKITAVMPDHVTRAVCELALQGDS